jgi:glycosyltransferase involved in cell wall biosynthesis
VSGGWPLADAPPAPAVSVLIPVYGSGVRAPVVVSRLLDALAGLGRPELLFCDDGSLDDSLAQLEATKADHADGLIRVLSHRNRGLGYTLARLIREAQADACVYLDMDLSFDVSHLPRLIALLADYDIVVASKYAGATCLVPLRRRLGSRAYRWLVHRLSGTRVRDIGSGMVAFRRARVAPLGLTSEGFNIHAELFDKAHRAACRVREEPVPYRHERGSFHLVRHGVLSVRDLLLYRYRLRR